MSFCIGGVSFPRSLLFFSVLVIDTIAAAEEYTLNSIDHGWYESSGENAMQDNTITGMFGGTKYRSLFIFDIPDECASGVRSADLAVLSDYPSRGIGKKSHVIGVNGLSLDHSYSIDKVVQDIDIFNDMESGLIDQALIVNNESFRFDAALTVSTMQSIEDSAGSNGRYALALSFVEQVTPQFIMGYSGAGSFSGELTIDCEAKASITIKQTIVSDNGGTAVSGDFVPLINAQKVEWGAENRVFSGEYSISETTVLPGYLMGSWEGDCNADGSIDLGIGKSAVCTIVNNDIPSTLLLTHKILNNSGGKAVEKDFDIYINGINGVWGVNQKLNANSYSLVMTALDGYQDSHWAGDCAIDGTIVLALGQIAACEIVSTDLGVDLVLDKSVSNVNPSIGDIITFSILVSNLGPGMATNVKVSDVVMKGLEYQQGSILGSNSRSDDDPYENGLNWEIHVLPVGVPVKLTFDAMILSP